MTPVPWPDRLVLDVLLIDADPDVRASVRQAMARPGLGVREAESGVAALHVLRDGPPDGIVMELALPGLDGFGLLRAIRQQHLAPGARILVHARQADDRDEVRAWELGCDDFVAKPADPAVLAARVRKLLAATPRVLQERRQTELEKAELFDRLEVVLHRPRGVAAPRPTRR